MTTLISKTNAELSGFRVYDKQRTETNRDELTSIEFVSSSYRFVVNHFPPPIFKMIYADYYLTENIYVVNKDGVYRYHNRNPSDDLTPRDHRLELIKNGDMRDALRSSVRG